MVLPYRLEGDAQGMGMNRSGKRPLTMASLVTG